MPWIEEQDDCLVLNIRVVPRASRDEIKEVMGDALKVRITAPPVEGKANACLVRFLAKHWQVPRASIEIIAGGTARSKRIRISHPPAALSSALRQLE